MPHWWGHPTATAPVKPQGPSCMQGCCLGLGGTSILHLIHSITPTRSLLTWGGGQHILPCPSAVTSSARSAVPVSVWDPTARTQ